MNNDPARKILVVEDEGIPALQLQKALNREGYKVTAVAASAEEAIIAIETCPPDLVLMDIQIQGDSDGVQTACEIRQRFGLPVIFVTAHADHATLNRARSAEPFGYIVKPISMLSLLSSIEMALHKHQVECQLAEHRSWLSTVLQAVPEAVIVTDISGNMQFLNDLAERLIGRKRSESFGENVSSLVQLDHGRNGDITAGLLQRAIAQGDIVQIPRETSLRNAHTGVNIPVEGEITISYLRSRPAGIIVTLRDASVRTKQDQECRQEQNIICVGQLSADIASNLHAPLKVISDYIKQIDGSMEQAKQLGLLNSVSRAMLMCEELTKLGEKRLLRAEIVSLNRTISKAEPVLRRICGRSLYLELDVCSDATSVFCHASHIEQILVDVVANVKLHVNGSGKIRILTDIVKGIQDIVRVRFQFEHSDSAQKQPHCLSPEMERPQLNLSVATAIITAAGGVLCCVKTSRRSSEVEMQLPRQQESSDAGSAFAARRGKIVIIGADQYSAGIFEREMEAINYVAIAAQSASEALLFSQLAEERIDLVIADGDRVSEHNCERLQKIFAGRNPNTKFLYLGSKENGKGGSWSRLAKPFRAHDIAEAANAILSAVANEGKAANV